MMKKMYCPECGGEIVVTREVEPLTFAISLDGDVLEDISNVLCHDAELIFHCCDDREHDIESHPDPNYGKWRDKVEDYFSRQVLPNL